MAQGTMIIEEGYAPTGVHWEIHKYKLRYTNLFEVRVNGKATQFRTKAACFKHLTDTKVTKFETVVADGQLQNQEVVEHEAAPEPNNDPTGNPDGGDGL